MFNEKAKAQDIVAAGIERHVGFSDSAKAGGVYTIKCFDKDGNLKWEGSSHNLVVNVGLKDMNDKYFSGSSYTAAWYLGLITGPGSGTTYSASDTMSSHSWTEDTNYSQSTRPACSFGSATTADPSVITNSGSPATYSINGTTTIAGAFLTSNSTKGGSDRKSTRLNSSHTDISRMPSSA